MRTYIKGMAVVLILFGLLMAAGCGTHEEPKPPTGDTLKSIMVGKKWKVDELFSRRVAGDMTMEFMSDGTVKAFGGCNEMSGPYFLEGESLSFGPMTSTRKSCGAVLDEQDYSFQTFLGTIDHVAVDGEDLRLTSKDMPDAIVLTTGSGGLFW